MARRFEFKDGQAIKDGHLVRVKRMNHITEVMSLLKTSSGLQSVVKLSKTEYMLTNTGEVLEYKLSENRAQNTAGLKDTFRKVRDLINTNFIGAPNELHLTLTYAENMTDNKKLLSDFKKFWLRYKYKFGDVDYLSVVEPQGRGAWHCHVLIRHNDGKKIFIPSADLAEMWGHGFIKVKSLSGVDNIGAYLSAYLGDVELTPETIEVAMNMKSANNLEIKEVLQKDGETKAYIKGGRLHMYPPGMNLYRHSKGIVFPEVEQMPYQDIKKIVGSCTPNYSRTITILGDDGETVLNEITYEQYNNLRP
jgi:hypothetical protein